MYFSRKIVSMEFPLFIHRIGFINRDDQDLSLPIHNQENTPKNRLENSIFIFITNRTAFAGNARTRIAVVPL